MSDEEDEAVDRRRSGKREELEPDLPQIHLKHRLIITLKIQFEGGRLADAAALKERQAHGGFQSQKVW